MDESPKSGINCNTTKCKAICCKGFVCEVGKLSEDAIKFIELHGCKYKFPQMWLPVVCKNLDLKTLKCKDYEHRPNVCRTFPTRKTFFIDKKICDLFD